MAEPGDVFAFACRCGARMIHRLGPAGRSCRGNLCPTCAEHHLRTTCVSASLRLLTQAQRLRVEDPDGEDARGVVADDLCDLATELAAACGAGKEAGS
jgi:hypothetical protein